MRMLSRFKILYRAGLPALALLLILPMALSQSVRKPPVAAEGDALTVDQLMKMPKIDAHAHISTLGPGQAETFIAFLVKHNFRWLAICTGGMDWNRLQQKIELMRNLHRSYPERIGWATSFDLSNWGAADWEKAATKTLTDGFSQGAVAGKVWKDIGMVLKDPDGKYVMIDDPRLGPVLDSIARQGHPLVAHLGEPRNCWLPLDSMTTDSDRSYFRGNPQYHGYLHPEVPGYTQQIAARDAVLKQHPQLKVVGCHLGSLEYDVDELAKRLDQYPNFAVDLAARMVHLQIQPREKVRNFILKYQDRILYATDLEIGGGKGEVAADLAPSLARIEGVYRLDATWLATDQQVEVPRAKAGYLSRGLALPAPVLRKIYYENARKWYPGL
jgi:predicted TIM-barrel fold metal-dependent hydrolase